MNVKTALIVVLGVAVAAVLAVQLVVAPSGPHAEFSEQCEKSLNAVMDWAVGEMERQGGRVSFAERTTTAGRVAGACGCVRDKLGAAVADDKWALAGKLTAIKFEAELAARTQEPTVHAHTEAEARAELNGQMSDDNVSATDIASLSQNIDGTMKACFRQHFSEP